jgi:hypothetical protein
MHLCIVTDGCSCVMKVLKYACGAGCGCACVMVCTSVCVCVCVCVCVPPGCRCKICADGCDVGCRRAKKGGGVSDVWGRCF